MTKDVEQATVSSAAVSTAHFGQAQTDELALDMEQRPVMFDLAGGIRSFSFAQLVVHARTPLFRNAYALILSDIVSSGLGVVYWMLAARYYSTEAVGLGAAAIATAMFLSGLSQLNLTGAMIRFIPCAGRATGRLVGLAYLSSILLAGVVSSLFVLTRNIWVPADSFLHTSPPLVLWFMVATMGWCVFALQDNVLTGLRRSIWVPVENATFGIAKIGLLIVFAGLIPQYGIFASWTIPAVVSLIPVNLVIFRRWIPKHVARTEKQATPLVVSQIVKFVAGDYVGSLFVEMSTTLLPVLVISQVGANATARANATAHFYLAWIIAYPLHLFSMNMAASLTVESAADPAKFAAHARRALAQLARLLVPIVAVVLIAAPTILSLFGAEYADQASGLLRLLVLSAIPSSINALYMSFARVQRRIVGIIVVQGALCALVLGLSWALIHDYGIISVGMAWTASQTIVAITLLLTQLRPIFLPHVYRNARRLA